MNVGDIIHSRGCGDHAALILSELYHGDRRWLTYVAGTRAGDGWRWSPVPQIATEQALAMSHASAREMARAGAMRANLDDDQMLLTLGELVECIHEEGWAVTDDQITDLHRRMVDRHVAFYDKDDEPIVSWIDEAREEGETIGREKGYDEAMTEVRNLLDGLAEDIAAVKARLV